MIYCAKMNIFECRAKFVRKPSQPHVQFYSNPFPPNCRHMSAKYPSQSMPDCLPKVAREHLVEAKLFSKQLSTNIIGHVGESPQNPVKCWYPMISHIGSIKRAISMNQHVQSTASHSTSQNSILAVLIVSCHENSCLHSCCIRLLLLEGFLQGPQHRRRDQIKWTFINGNYFTLKITLTCCGVQLMFHTQSLLQTPLTIFAGEALCLDFNRCQGWCPQRLQWWHRTGAMALWVIGVAGMIMEDFELLRHYNIYQLS